MTGPLGFFDPLGFCSGTATEGKIRFYREVELKHARVAMLAAIGVGSVPGAVLHERGSGVGVVGRLC